MKNLSAQHFRSTQAVADGAVNAAPPLTSLQISRIASCVCSGDGDDLVPAPEQPFRSSLVSAVLDHLRKTRMQKFRPH